jgi:hypothetical protein
LNGGRAVRLILLFLLFGVSAAENDVESDFELVLRNVTFG